MRLRSVEFCFPRKQAKIDPLKPQPYNADVKRNYSSYGLVGLVLVLGLGCASRTRSFKGPGHDADWPIEADRAPAYEAFLKAERLGAQGEIDKAISALEKALAQDRKSPLILTRLAYAYTRKQDYVRAEQYARMALASDSEYRDALFLLGKLQTEQQKYPQAEATFRKLIALGPELNRESTYEELYITLAAMYVEWKKPESAVFVLQELLAQNPNNYIGYYYLGRVYSEMDQMKEALRAYEQSVEVNSTFSPGVKAMALIYEYEGNLAQAIKSFREALRMEPDNIDVRNHLGQLLLESQKYDAALKEFEAVLEQDPHETNALLRTGLIYFRSGSYENAHESFSRLLERLPTFDQVRYYLAIVLEKLGKPTRAIDQLKDIESKSTVYIEARLALAYLYEIKKKPGRTETVLLEGVSKKPEASRLRAALASVLVKSKRYEQAVAVLKDGLALSEKDETLWFSLGEIYDKMENLVLLEKCMRTVIEINADNASALNYLGYTFAEKGIRLDEAEQLIKRALEVKPEDGYINDSLGWLYFKRQRYEKAMKVLKKAMEKAPDEPVIMEHYADTLIKLAETQNQKRYYREAKDIYERASELSSDPTEKERLEGKIKTISWP